ncbi:Calcium-transporting ATPase 10, plasma membrane-type [Phlyctochytrium planicorne]|nr:Calcium-transporting ATPase 10, plasma membrane-type [Phlyctochytrium planicorne]
MGGSDPHSSNLPGSAAGVQDVQDETEEDPSRPPPKSLPPIPRPTGGHSPSPSAHPPSVNPRSEAAIEKKPAAAAATGELQLYNETTALKLKEIRDKMSGLGGGYGITPEELCEVCNFDRRTNPAQLGTLDSDFGGVVGVALLLKSDVHNGLALKHAPDHQHVPAAKIAKPSGKVTPVEKEGETGHDMTALDQEKRKGTFGVNKIPPPRSETIFELVWGTIKEDPIIKVLLVGAIVVLGLGTAMCPKDGWLEGTAVFIAVFIVLSVTAGNDYQKDLKFKKLLLLQSDKRVKVVRGGIKDEVSSWDIMVGDVVELTTGDEIPADGIFISGNRLVVDESPLTGESIPVKKNPQAPFLFSGCQVSEGSGRMLITGVGIRSSGGQIQELLNEAQSEETVLQKKLKIVAILIGKVGVAAGIATFLGLAIRWAIYWATGKEDVGGHGCAGANTNPTMMHIQTVAGHFVVGITIVVVAVPEGLPLAVTISLAFSMFKMIQDKCFVRHLDASETMGEATCICTDKTGTLTENKMTVVKLLLGDKLYYGEGSGEANAFKFEKSSFEDGIREVLIENFCLNSDCFIKINEENGSDMFIGSATEGAMLVLCRNLGYDYDAIRSKVEKVEGGVWSFSSDRKRMSTLVKPIAPTPTTPKQKYRLYSKGASEIILGLCTHMLDVTGTQVTKMTPNIAQRIQRIITRWASEGLRTIGLAYRDTDQMITTLEVSFDGQKDDPEHDLVWIGLIGIKDPLRKEVPGAVAKCQKAGLTVRMVTGDNILTACKISRECNILFGDLIALEGPVFRAMSKEEKIAVVPKLAVLARSSPADKHTLVSLLKELGEVVAVTGDGTNDAPALKEADVGFAMGISGTQIARNASDIILLDDNFVSIVQSIRWGRNVLNSVRKFLQFQLGVNLIAIILTFVGSVVIGESPLSTVQLLWVNLIMDSLGALALASDDPDDDILDHPPHRRTESLLSMHMIVYMCIQIVYQLIILITIYLGLDSLMPGEVEYYTEADLLHDGGVSKRTKTVVFTAFIMLQVSNIFMARQLNSELNVFKNLLRNKLFILIASIIVGVQVLGVTVGGSFLSTVFIRWHEWVLCLAVSFANFLFTIAARAICRVYIKEEHPKRPPGGSQRSIAQNSGDANNAANSGGASPTTSSAAPGPVNAWSSITLNINDGPHAGAASPAAASSAPKKSRWRTVQSAVALIGQFQDVHDPQYERNGPDEDFLKTWMRFRKDVRLPTKTGVGRSVTSLKGKK